MRKEKAMLLWRTNFSKCIHVSILTVILLAAPAAVLAANGRPLLDRFSSIQVVGSTVPANGDVNPYGVAIVQHSIGLLNRGDILVSNFNNSANPPSGLQGTGTTIVQLSPQGNVSLFAQINAAALGASCPGGVGLTTALVELKRGWVIVGSLPTTDGTAATAMAGCLIVLDSNGNVVETFAGGGINGPWDMTALDDVDHASLFVTNVLNGDVTVGPAHVVNQGTVLRLDLDVPKVGQGMPTLLATTTIGSGFSETSDPSALVIGPTGVGLAPDGTLYVADSVNSRIAAIPSATTRTTTADTGVDVSIAGALNDPLGLALAPNGNIITANGLDGNLVETTPQGAQVAVKTVTPNGGGALFGLAILNGGRALYFVDDGENNLKVLINETHGHGG
jgi:hypothetical protein